MNFSTARSERITAIISTVVAVAILAGGVTAYQSHHAPVDDVVQLESDLRFQLEVAFRHDPNERARRLVKLEEVSQAWQQSPRATADREQLADWLLEATIRSMPGSIEKLPSVPQFGEPTPQQPLAQQTPDVLVEPPVAAVNVTMVNNDEENSEPTELVPTPASFVSAEPLEPISPSTETHAAESLAVPQPETVVAQVVVSPSIRINLTELAARIAGYHEGLNEIETALLTLDAEDFSSLTEQIRLFAEMARDFRFVKLYYEALTDQERRAVTAPRTMAATLAEIERRIDRTQEALSGDFLGEFDPNHRDRIRELRQQLTKITATTK